MGSSSSNFLPNCMQDAAIAGGGEERTRTTYTHGDVRGEDRAPEGGGKRG